MLRIKGEQELGSDRLIVRILLTALVSIAGFFPSFIAPEDASAKPTLLMFHGGGFVLGDAAQMSTAAEIARAHGFRPVPVEYPTR